jgi:predicted glycosyltransferase
MKVNLMKIVVGIAHPAHVHFYKNFIQIMQKKGHKIKIVAKNKDVSINLLNNYGFNFDVISTNMDTGLKRIRNQIEYEYNLYNIVKHFNPDIITGVGGTTASHVSKVTKAKSIIFTDNYLKYDKFITHPWADTIITPTSFSHDLGEKQIKVPSFKELAYLHPDIFSPNSDVYDFMNLKESDRFIVVRFVSFKALHDTNVSGFNEADKIKLVKILSKFAKIFISHEGKLPSELKEYAIRFPPEKIHDALYFADLLVTDSQTMTTEAAILGTPAVRCNDWVGSGNEMVNFIELQNKYGLIYNYSNSNLAIKKCCELLSKKNNKNRYGARCKTLISEKINFTDFLVWLFENYFLYNNKNIQSACIDYINYNLGV